MSAWLAGHRARLVGESPAIRAALEAQGATLVDDGDCEVGVHVAAAPTVRPSHEVSHAEWRATLDDGLDGFFRLAQDFASHRRAAGAAGALLFVGAPEQSRGSDHAAATGALGNLVKTLGVEWARDGIRVNAILTLDRGETLGNLAAYLVSDYAAYVTGAVMGIASDDR